jgi:excisionase family DNA binding protein
MSLEHSPARQKRKKAPRQPHKPLPPAAYSIADVIDLTKLSRPTLYRMMADGRLRYVQVTSALRRIPAAEVTRLVGCTSEI